MSRQIQIRRGTTVENDNFTGAEGEITVDTTTKQLRIHDGTTMGGFIVGRESYTKTETDALLSGKSSTDLSNITADAKETIAHNAMPSSRYIDLPLGASGSNYTAPADGYVCFYMSQPGTHDLQIYLSNETKQIKVRTYQPVNDICCWIPVAKSDVFKLEYSWNSGSYVFQFIYAEGAQ